LYTNCFIAFSIDWFNVCFFACVIADGGLPCVCFTEWCIHCLCATYIFAIQLRCCCALQSLLCFAS
jgi:hypothetical protein